MGNYGFKVSETGYSVFTADIENLSFSSSYPFFKIHSDSTSGLTVPAGTNASLTFSHTLGYVPAFMMYTTAFTGDTYSRPLPRGVSPQGLFGAVYSSSSNVILLIKSAGLVPEFTITVRCIIFKDRIS